MKYTNLPILTFGLFFLCSCGIFYGKQPDGVSEMRTPKPLAVSVGKNWQVIEEPPKLTNEQERPFFQTEQSLQPGEATVAPPEDSRKIEVPR